MRRISFLLRGLNAVLIVGVSFFVAETRVSAETRLDTKKAVIEGALRAKVPPSLALAVAKVESDFDGRALSKAGARGVMQIMPATASGEFGIEVDQLWNSQLNIHTGVTFLRRLFDMYGGRWDLALSHYNGGTLKRVDGIPVAHKYTFTYVQKVLRWQRRYAEQAELWSVALTPLSTPNAKQQQSVLKSVPRAKPVRTAVSDSVSQVDQELQVWKARRPLEHKSARADTAIESDGFSKRLRAVRNKLDDFSM